MSSLGDKGGEKFNPIDRNDPFTYASGSDGEPLRAQRVVVGAPMSGAMATIPFVLKAKDKDGNEQFILATDDPQNTGSYSLKVDTETQINISGSTWVVSNIKVGSKDQTSGTLRYLYVEDDGTVRTHDTFTSASVSLYSEKQTATGSVKFGLSGSWLSGSSWNVCKKYKEAAIYVEYEHSGVGLGNNTLYMRLQGSADVASADEWKETQLVVGAGQSEIDDNVYMYSMKDMFGSPAKPTDSVTLRAYFKLDVSALEGFKFAISESIGTSCSTGTLSLYYTMSDK